jgi:hypothetical protein
MYDKKAPIEKKKLGRKFREDKKIDTDSWNIVVDDEEYNLLFGKIYLCSSFEFEIMYAYYGSGKRVFLIVRHRTINNVWREECVEGTNLFKHFSEKNSTRDRGTRFSKLNGLKYIKKITGKDSANLTKDDLTFDKFIQVGTAEFDAQFELSLAFKVMGKMK